MIIVVEALRASDGKPVVFTQEVNDATPSSYFDVLGEFAQEHEHATIVRMYSEE